MIRTTLDGSRPARKARRIPCASLFLSGLALIVFLHPALEMWLQFDRLAIARGEIWRLVSGHWVHDGFDHLFWDVLAFVVLGVACEGRSRSRFLLCVAGATFAISLAVWFWLADMVTYRGLSGLDSALFALLFMEFTREGLRTGDLKQIAVPAACFGAFTLKTAFELTTGGTLFVNSFQSGTVAVPLAHIVGAAVGLAVGSWNLGRDRASCTIGVAGMVCQKRL